MLARIDTALFNLINRDSSNRLLDFLMPLISALGEGGIIFTAGIVILLITKNGRKISAMLLFAGLTVSYYVVHSLKDSIARPRPFMIMPYAHQLAAEDSYSLPSGHATVAFMAAFVLSWFFKRYTWLFYLFALLVGFSRVYLGVHYISDVAAGALIGTFIGYLLVRVTKNINSSKE